MQMEGSGGKGCRRTVACVVAVAVVAAHDDIVVLEVARAVLEVVEGGAELASEGRRREGCNEEGGDELHVEN
jgi:hypothetical protein